MALKGTGRHPGELADVGKQRVEAAADLFVGLDFHPMVAVDLKGALNEDFGRGRIVALGRQGQHRGTMHAHRVEFLDFAGLGRGRARGMLVGHGAAPALRALAAALLAQAPQDVPEQHQRNDHQQKKDTGKILLHLD